MDASDASDASGGTRQRGWKWLMIGTLAVAAGLFVADHWVHVPRFLPYLLLALCPLMHMFGHGGHSHESHRHVSSRGTARNVQQGEL